MSHAFLQALEQHGAVDNDLGWQPQHLGVYQGDELVAACAGYLTGHSFGDFVYDWNWARIARMQGIDWYPKWVIEVPYSPVTGPRLLADDDSDDFRRALINGLLQIAGQQQLACLQVNYCRSGEAELLQQAGFILRPDTQLHWHNQNYQCFDDFLASLTSKRRKETRRERRKIADQNIHHRWVSGIDASAEDIFFAHACYQKTFSEYGNYPALSTAFFEQTCQSLGGQIQFCIAADDHQNLGCAIFLRSAERLFGRYWGCLEQRDCLHFETCFYQGIDYCVQHGLQAFEPGAGGGHKLNRGFLPHTIYTAHWIADPELRGMLSHLAGEEDRLDRESRQHISEHTPFRTDDD